MSGNQYIYIGGLPDWWNSQRGSTRGEATTLCTSPWTTPEGYYKRFALILQALASKLFRNIIRSKGGISSGNYRQRVFRKRRLLCRYICLVKTQRVQGQRGDSGANPDPSRLVSFEENQAPEENRRPRENFSPPRITQPICFQQKSRQ